MATSDPRYAWQEAGLYEVAPQVYRIPLPLPNDGLAAVNAYVVTGDGELLIIDPGWGLTESRTQLEDALARLGAGLGDATHFLVTHHHRDHYTQAVQLRREFGTTISLGAEEKHSLQVVNDPQFRAVNPQFDRLVAAGARSFAEDLQRLMAGHPREPLSDWEMPDRWLTDGFEYQMKNRTLQAISTPGHARGHFVFRDAEAGLLFAGDHVLPHITPSIGFEAAPAELPLRAFLDSLKLV